MLLLKRSQPQEVTLKKIWALPELRHFFSITCQLKGPFIVLTLKVNSDSKNERAIQFNNLLVSEKTSGKHLFSREGVMVFAEGSNKSTPSVTIEDAINVVEKVNNLTEDTLRVEG